MQGNSPSTYTFLTITGPRPHLRLASELSVVSIRLPRLPWLRRVLTWLRRVPISDPVDRRNAPALQVLLLFLGVEIPLNKAYHLVSGHISMTGLPLVVDVATDVAITAAAFAAVWMIRKGDLKQGVGTFIAVLMCCAVAANLAFGHRLQSFDPYPMVMLTLAALVIGRRALWLVYACIPVVFALGMASPWGRHPQGNAFQNLPSLAFSYLMIAIVLDRTGAALRESLWKAQRSAQALRLQMRERERMRERMLHMQKIESVGHLASGVSHDFNNILNAIIGYTDERHRLDELDFDPEPDARRMAQALEGIALAAQRGVAVSRKLLRFGRLDTLAPVRFDAGQALAELAPMLRHLLGGSVRVDLDLPEVPTPVFLDRGQFELVILNVAANARDAMPAGGTFHLVLRADADAVHLVVSDTGVGMSPAVLARAFEAFFTTKPPGQGTGLGLAVVRETVEEAGGRLSVHSQPSQGTRLTLQLPRAMDQLEGRRT